MGFIVRSNLCCVPSGKEADVEEVSGSGAAPNSPLERRSLQVEPSRNGQGPNVQVAEVSLISDDDEDVDEPVAVRASHPAESSTSRIIPNRTACCFQVATFVGWQFPLANAELLGSSWRSAHPFIVSVYLLNFTFVLSDRLRCSASALQCGPEVIEVASESDEDVDSEDVIVVEKQKVISSPLSVFENECFLLGGKPIQRAT